MRRLIVTTIAGLVLAGPLSIPAFAQQNSQQQQYGDQRNDNSRNDDRRGDGNAQQQASGHHGNSPWRDTRTDARWNAREHNGYYIKNTWHAGPPPAAAYRQKGFQLGYKPWKKGDRLGYFKTRYAEVDYRSHKLKTPPRGYHYVQDDNGDVILAAIATGLIAAIISGNG